MSQITLLLDAVKHGDRDALDDLFSLLSSDLHHLAYVRLMGGARPAMLDTTSLVHESYLRFLKAGHVEVADKSHFLAYSAKVMRSIIVDFARKRAADRRGGAAAEV